MGALDHPAARLVAGFTRDRVGVFTPCPDVRGGPTRGQQCAHVIAFVQTPPLWLLGSGPRALDRDPGEGLLGHLEVMPMGALHGEAEEARRRRR